MMTRKNLVLRTLTASLLAVFNDWMLIYLTIFLDSPFMFHLSGYLSLIPIFMFGIWALESWMKIKVEKRAQRYILTAIGAVVFSVCLFNISNSLDGISHVLFGTVYTFAYEVICFLLFFLLVKVIYWGIAKIQIKFSKRTIFIAVIFFAFDYLRSYVTVKLMYSDPENQVLLNIYAFLFELVTCGVIMLTAYWVAKSSEKCPKKAIVKK